MFGRNAAWHQPFVMSFEVVACHDRYLEPAAQVDLAPGIDEHCQAAAQIWHILYRVLKKPLQRFLLEIGEIDR